MDKLSKTVKAGVHGIAGGEHIVHLDSGEYRYLTVRECMRIHDLPDEMEIDTTRTAAMRQIGNAMSPTFGEVFGRAIAQAVGEKPAPKFVRQKRGRAQGSWRRRRGSAGARSPTDSADLHVARSCETA